MTPEPPRRIAVVGVSGSGKSTLCRFLAKRLRLRHVKIDRIFWQANRPAREEFCNLVHEALDGTDWVADGNYHAVEQLTWEQADLVIWLDPPRSVLVWRLVRRRIRQGTRPAATGKWHGSWRAFFFSRRSIVPTCWRAVRNSRTRYGARMAENGHLRVVHVRKQREISALLQELTGADPAFWPPGARAIAAAQ